MVFLASTIVVGVALAWLLGALFRGLDASNRRRLIASLEARLLQESDPRRHEELRQQIARLEEMG